MIRIARPDDANSLSILLELSYSHLLAHNYDPDILRLALPYMVKANGTLLESGTYYLMEPEPGIFVGCGGWTRDKPGSGEIVQGEGHVRHFAVHPDWIKRGIGTALLTRCITDAALDGIRKLHCFSTLNAVSFYRTSGFETIRMVDIQMGPAVAFPAVLMERRIS